MSFLSMTELKLKSDNFPALQDKDGFSVAIYVPAIDESSNNLLSSDIKIALTANNSSLASRNFSNVILNEINSTALYV